ncbi:MAG: FimV/HubP family polar landmark protein [Woeseiaceae bacterium]|nr:FimV/HubP family polar landmark protein [Woeseiaceae bacterium]
MPRRLVRFSLALVFLLSSQAFALGLGEIRIDSALNEPLRAEIELLSATPEELSNLKVALASEATFERYGLDRPFYLTDLVFQVVKSGRGDGNVIIVSSPNPVTEPFLTFLVEATWSSGRLLREYTVLLDPPTFAPPAASRPAPAVTAPERAEPADSGRIERTPAPRPAEPAPARPAPEPVRPATTPAPTEPRAMEPEPAPEPAPAPAPVDEAPYSTAADGDMLVQRGDTLWGIAARMRPDSRLTMNQTMLAIFRANPEAFGGNMNLLRAGATLRMPSADDIYRIDRGDAFREAQRQHSEWDSGYTPAPAPEPAPAPVDTTQPSLQLVPPDEDLETYVDGAESPAEGEPLTREEEILDRISELEAEGIPDDQALIEIRDNELASLREELARIRGEVYEPPLEPLPEEDPFLDEAEIDDAGDLAGADESIDEPAIEEPESVVDDVQTVAPAPTRRAPSLVDQVLGWLSSIYAKIIAIALVAVGVLLWFLRRRKGEEDHDDWQPMGRDSVDADAGTETLAAPDRGDDSFVVVEQRRSSARAEPTIETPAFSEEAPDDQTGTFGSLEDTFSSETAVNLDQSDPIAEADFHMAYGLYDQAADLINGAIEADPGRQDLLSKLCEIYFVWGNRDAFVDAASRLKGVVGAGESAEWDKIVIMGQQIAGDHELFAGAGTAAATREMDLSFDSDDDGTGALDMEFGDDSSGGEVIDLGAGAPADDGDDDDGVDFLFDQEETSTNDSNVLDMDFDPTAESPTLQSLADSDKTREMDVLDSDAPSGDAGESDSLSSTLESPTIEEQFASLGSTSELPSLDDTDTVKSVDTTATAEIDLDDLDLDLDVDGMAETELASFDDLDATGTNETLSDTGINAQLEDEREITGRNPEVDPDATGVQMSMSEDDIDSTGLGEALDIDDVLSRTGTMRLAPDETGLNPMFVPADEGDDEGEDLLAATGKTQVLPEDFAVDTGIMGDDEATLLAGLDDDDDNDDDDGATIAIGSDDATLLAGLDDDDDNDFDFAKTEALPADAFATGDLDETGEIPVGNTDFDLDLDDLTAALKVSAGGDTVDMQRDDATVEQPRPGIDEIDSPTLSLGPEDMGDDLDDARTMTEVGTKLDLARAYVDMGDPGGARSILEEVLDEGDDAQRQQAQSLLDSLPA